VASVVVHPVTEDRPDLLPPFADVWAETDRAVNPDDPPAPVEEVAGELFASWTHERRDGWLATVDGEPVGVLAQRVDDSDENRHRVEVEWVGVREGHRRHGVASALLRAGLAHAASDGRTSVTAWVPALPDGVGSGWAERLGMSLAQEERCSRLVLADLDADLVARWRDEGRARTDGYRLVQWTGPVPDEHVALMATVRRAMEDAPTDDLDGAVAPMTEDDVRSFDESAARRGLLPVLTAALAPDGEPAGYSALFLNRHRPALGWQGDTGVLAGHRGRGLGRWLKAENLEQARALEPRLAVVETYNAESNPWMLDINVAMGFRPHVGYQAWQGPMEAVRAALG